MLVGSVQAIVASQAVDCVAVPLPSTSNHMRSASICHALRETRPQRCMRWQRI